MSGPNRQKRLAPKGGSAWCSCDRAKVRDGAKCPACGQRKLPKRMKP